MNTPRILPILLLAWLLQPVNVYAETVAIIGTGDVASALGPAFANQGHRIVYGSRDPESSKARSLANRTSEDAVVLLPPQAVVDADIVVLAVPGLLVADIVPGLGDLRDKIIIDPTNPLRRKRLTFEHGVDTSNAQIIQALAPDAFVVKAFNTLSWKTRIQLTLQA